MRFILNIEDNFSDIMNIETIFDLSNSCWIIKDNKNKNDEDEHKVAERKWRSRSLVSEGYNSDYMSNGN